MKFRRVLISSVLIIILHNFASQKTVKEYVGIALAVLLGVIVKNLVDLIGSSKDEIVKEPEA